MVSGRQVPLPFMAELQERWWLENNWRTWITRHNLPTLEDALREARMAHPFAKVPLYVVRSEVPKGFEKHWPDKYHWQISDQRPFSGVAGYDYYPRPEYYIVNLSAIEKEVLVPAEDPEPAARIRAHLRREFEALKERDRERFKEASS